MQMLYIFFFIAPAFPPPHTIVVVEVSILIIVVEVADCYRLNVSFVGYPDI
jgi:hypothetical protein